LRVVGDIFGQEFERDKAPQREVFCLIDDTHAAATELLENTVVRDVLADPCAEILGPERGNVKEAPARCVAFRIREPFLQSRVRRSPRRLRRARLPKTSVEVLPKHTQS
jgi:hypothetical protein